MSEISTYVSSGPGVPRKPGAVGKAQPGRRVAVLPLDGGNEPLPAGEEGLLAVHRSDPGLMLGYWQRPAGRSARSIAATGSSAAISPSSTREGYVFHRGRANDLMKALGYRVSPLEVEAALAEHPSIAEVACAEVARARRRQRHRRLRRAACRRARRTPPTSNASRPSALPPTSGRAPSCLSRRCRAPPTARSCARRCAFPTAFPQANAVASEPRPRLFHPRALLTPQN